MPAISSKSLTKDTYFDNYLLIFHSYLKIPELIEMENISTEEFMDKQVMFQAIFGKVYWFFCWDMDIIQNDAGMQFNSEVFQEGIHVRGVQISSVAPDNQEVNG